MLTTDPIGAKHRMNIEVGCYFRSLNCIQGFAILELAHMRRRVTLMQVGPYVFTLYAVGARREAPVIHLTKPGWYFGVILLNNSL